MITSRYVSWPDDGNVNQFSSEESNRGKLVVLDMKVLDIPALSRHRHNNDNLKVAT